MLNDPTEKPPDKSRLWPTLRETLQKTNVGGGGAKPQGGKGGGVTPDFIRLETNRYKV